MPVYLTDSVAQRIVDRTMAIIGHNVNVMDRKGVIIGTGDITRLHTVHEGALQVLASGKACDLKAENVEKLNGVQIGINRPVQFRGEIAGVIGISGDPEKVSQFEFEWPGNWSMRSSAELNSQHSPYPRP